MESIILLIALFFSHYIVDYTTIGNTIEIQDKPFYTLIIHSFIHSIILGFILWLYSMMFANIEFDLIICSMLIQLSSHYLIDMWVGLMNKYYPKVETKTMQSLILGVDQFLHSVALIIIYFILN
jgi:hypothetical protein